MNKQQTAALEKIGRRITAAARMLGVQSAQHVVASVAISRSLERLESTLAKAAGFKFGPDCEYPREPLDINTALAAAARTSLEWERETRDEPDKGWNEACAADVRYKGELENCLLDPDHDGDCEGPTEFMEDYTKSVECGAVATQPKLAGLGCLRPKNHRGDHLYRMPMTKENLATYIRTPPERDQFPASVGVTCCFPVGSYDPDPSTGRRLCRLQPHHDGEHWGTEEELQSEERCTELASNPEFAGARCMWRGGHEVAHRFDLGPIIAAKRGE